MREIDLIDINELSKRVNISPRWIRQQIKLGKTPMPHFRVGTRIRFYYPKVLDWLDAKTNFKV